MMPVTEMKWMMEMIEMTMRMQIGAHQCGDCSFKSLFPNFTVSVNCTLLTALQTALC